jgi:two-component system CheB/CheR fusion protein
MTELTPDHAERALADLIDNVVPTHGYQMTPLVGLGGSAGAIAALQAFFHAMPPDSGQAFVVILHLSPEHESTLPEILQRCTTMPVVQVSGSVRAAPDTVYVIPPGKLIKSLDGSLTLSDEPASPGRKASRRPFFRTLATRTVLMLPRSCVGSRRRGRRHQAIGARRTHRGRTRVRPSTRASCSAIATGMVDCFAGGRDGPEVDAVLRWKKKAAAGGPPPAQAAVDGEVRAA